MTTKEWLNRGYNINKEIEQLVCAKERAEALAGKVTSPINDVRVQSGTSNANEDKFIKVADYSLVIHRRISKLLEIQREIVQAISEVEDSTLRAILTARYVNFKAWDKISEEMHFDVDCKYIFKLHRKALREIEKNKIGH